MNQQFAILLKERKTIVLVILVLSIAIIGLIWQSGVKEKEGEPSAGLSDKDAILFEGEPSAVSGRNKPQNSAP